jgi:hypothetical protein
MILNGFCLLHKDSLAASPGTNVKIWNCLRANARRLEGGKPPESEVNKMSENKNEGSTSQADPSQKTQQVSGHGPVAGQAEPSIEDRVKALEDNFKRLEDWMTNQFTSINAKLDTLILVKSAAVAVATPPAQPPSPTIVAAPATASVEKTEQVPCGHGKKTEDVVAAIKPVEPVQHMVVLTEQEILGVLTDKRRFTPALQLNGILDLLEAKKREAA